MNPVWLVLILLDLPAAFLDLALGATPSWSPSAYTLNSGEPQGSYLGPFLFAASTHAFGAFIWAPRDLGMLMAPHWCLWPGLLS